MRNTKILSFLIVILFLSTFIMFIAGQNCSSSLAYGQENNQSERKELSREEILEKLNKTLKRRASLREVIPGIELIGESETGHLEFNGIRIDQLDNSTLKELLSTTITESRNKQLENMERLQSQMQNIENINRINQQIKQINTPPASSPKTYTLPPTVPSVPRSVPRAPAMPPSVPQRR